MSNYRTSTLIIVLINLFALCNAQTNQDFKILNNSIDNLVPNKISVAQSFSDNLQTNGSEAQWAVTSLFYIYKEFLSSQDFNNCSFTPSCSVYGVECLKQHGMLKGGVMTMDRLTRCHGFTPSRYEKDYKNALLIDKVPE